MPHACCGVVSNGGCDVSALRGAVFKRSAAPPPPNGTLLHLLTAGFDSVRADECLFSREERSCGGHNRKTDFDQ